MEDKSSQEIIRRSEFLAKHGDMVEYKHADKPFYQRSWFRNTSRLGFLIGATVVALAIPKVEQLIDKRNATMSGKRAELKRFLNSKEFQEYADSVSERAFWALKYIGDNQEEAQKGIPLKENNSLPWTAYAQKLQEGNQPKSTVVHASNFISRGLVKKGFDFKGEEKSAGLDKMLQLLPPYTFAYERNTKTEFIPYIRFEPAMEYDIVRALAKNRGPNVTASEIERLGVICKYFGDKGMKYAGKLEQDKMKINMPKTEALPIKISYNGKSK